MLTNTVCGDEYLFDFREAQIESVHGNIPTGTSVVSGTQVPHDEATPSQDRSHTGWRVPVRINAAKTESCTAKAIVAWGT